MGRKGRAESVQSREFWWGLARLGLSVYKEERVSEHSLPFPLLTTSLLTTVFLPVITPSRTPPYTHKHRGPLVTNSSKQASGCFLLLRQTSKREELAAIHLHLVTHTHSRSGCFSWTARSRAVWQHQTTLPQDSSRGTLPGFTILLALPSGPRTTTRPS